MPITEVNIADIGHYLSTKKPVSMILPVSDSMISSASFGEGVKQITDYMNNAMGTSFRCLIYPLGMSYEIFIGECDTACRAKYMGMPHNEGLYLIQEHIHHAEFAGTDDLIIEFAQTVKNAETIKNYYNAVTIRGWVQTFAGYLMQLGTIIAHIATPVIALLLDEKTSVNLIPALQKPHEWMLGLLESRWLPLIALSFAVALIYSVTNILYWLKSTSKKLSEMSANMTSYGALMYSGLPFVCNILLFRLVFREHWTLLLLCIATAFCMDIIRRSRYNTIRRREALKKPSVAEKRILSLDQKLLDVRSRFVSAPFRVPYLDRERRPVFISYTHASTWAQNMAERLYRELTERGTPCFLDKHNIQRGSSWHKRLIESMDTAHTVICLVDEYSIGNAWPAEELETALRLRSISGNPNVYLLLKKGLKPEELNPMPIFKEVLQRTDTDQEMAIVLREADESPVLIAEQLQKHELANSVFGIFGSVILDFCRRPLNFLTLATTSLLWIAFVIAALVNLKLQFFENQVERSEVACLIWFLLACYVVTVSIIDVLMRGFMYKAVTSDGAVGAAVGSLAGILNGFLSLWVIYYCLQELPLRIEYIFMAFICVAAAACSISALHENMVRNNMLQFGNER